MILFIVLSLIEICGYAEEQTISIEQNVQNDKVNNFYPEYTALVKAIQSSGIEINKKFKKEVCKYLSKQNNLIGFNTSKEGLVWNFHDLIFLRKDLVFVSYDDGEMYGGDLLLQVNYSESQILSINVLWNSSSEN